MSIRLALVCAVSVAAIASAAAAQPGRVATEIFVSDAGVNFSDPAETAGFYASLERAASNACKSRTSRSLTVTAGDRQCAAESLDRAVRQSGKSALATLHEGRTGRSAPATVLAAQ